MIDIEKFICSLLADHPEGIAVRGDIHRALKEQGLEYKDGKIVPIEDKTELKESKDEKIKKRIIALVNAHGQGMHKEEMLAWLEKQSEQKPIERKDFVSIPFGAFDSEMVNETITIPDGCVATIEGNKIHIKKKDKSATEAIKLNHIVDNNDMAESTFKAGDWVVRTNGESFCNGNKFAQIESIELDGEMCYLDTGRWLYPSEIRLWTIYDAQDGDLIYVSTEEKSIGAIFDKIANGIIFFHCYLCGDFTQGGYMPMGNVELIYPWQKANHQRLFQKMKEAGFNWDNEKKELKNIMERNETN